MTKEAEQIDNEQLQTKLCEILESYPLYREYRYKGANHNHLPALIERSCPQCEKRTEWQNAGLTPTDKIQFQHRHYRCRNCKDQMVYFAYSWYEISETVNGKQETISAFSKYGQSPEIEETVSKELQKALGDTDDLKLYKNALRSKSFNYGIGAVAYMRRVIENHINDMIDVLKEEAVKDGKAGELTKQDIPLRFEDKVDFVAKLFPAVVTPENFPNPVKPLYKLASDAIHNLSESEAVDTFDQCRIVFEYIFESLRPGLNRRRAFLDGVQAITQLSASKKVSGSDV